MELYDLETRLKALVKRSIEQEIRNKNFGNRNGNFEKNAVVKNQGTKQRGQRILGNCWQWETNGQCVKGDKCSFRHDINKRGKSSPSNPSPNSCMRKNERKRALAVECRDGLARITLEEFAIIRSVKNGTVQNACTTRPRVVVGLGRSAHSHIVRLMNSRRNGPKRIMTKVLWLC